MNIKNLKDLREDNDKKQYEIAKILGITSQQYSLYETNQRSMPIDKLLILADYYNVSLDYLCGRTKKDEKKHANDIKTTLNNTSVLNENKDEEPLLQMAISLLCKLNYKNILLAYVYCKGLFDSQI